MYTRNAYIYIYVLLYIMEKLGEDNTNSSKSSNAMVTIYI